MATNQVKTSFAGVQKCYVMNSAGLQRCYFLDSAYSAGLNKAQQDLLNSSRPRVEDQR